LSEQNRKISVIIPAYNEAEVIGKVVTSVVEQGIAYEVIVVDDGSHDETAEVARQAGARVVRHPYNIGNGAAVKNGIRMARGDVMVFMDGDGQHDPADIPAMLEHLDSYDMVVGTRSRAHQASLKRFFGNKIFNLLASYVAKFPIKDLTSGFRAVKADVARRFLYLLPNTYSYPTTLTLGVLRSGRRVKYVPIRTRPRRQGSSNIKVFRDGIRFFLIITKICVLYSPFRVFLPISFLMFLAGLSRYIYTFITVHRFTNMSALLLITSVLIFMMGLISEQICQMRYDKAESDQWVELDE
jgi:glycosyltransferase involved in cell wall biosynthesis